MGQCVSGSALSIQFCTMGLIKSPNFVSWNPYSIGDPVHKKIPLYNAKGTNLVTKKTKKGRNKGKYIYLYLYQAGITLVLQPL